VFSSLGPQFRTGLRRRGKKAESRITASYLDDALSDFSGYIAADELYDGPFCVLSIVDNHRFKRLLYEVLDHDPTHEDMVRFFRRLRQVLDVRGLELLGVTTDGSPLYPEPLVEVFGDVPHQICEFHVLKEINRSILKAVAWVRRELKQQQPKLPRGRPSSQAARKAARKKKRLQAKIAALFEFRYLFVKRSLTEKEKKILRHVTRGFPRLRTLRSIADEVYRLFDRRCRTDTALEKLAGLRRRVRRFKTPLSSSASRDRAMISIPRARNRSSHATRSATPSKQGAHHVAQKSTSTTFPCRPAIRAFSFARSIVRRASSCGLVWRPSGPCAGVVAAHPQRPAAASVTSVPVAFHRNAERSLNVAAPPPATSPGPCGT